MAKTKNGTNKRNIMLKILMRILILATMMSGIMSCTETNDILSEPEEQVAKTSLLDFNVSYDDFDVTTTRTTSSTAWKNGDKVYLTFENKAYGVATYDSENWTIEYFGNFTKNKKGFCKVVYFSSPKSVEAFQAVNLTYETAIYEDTLATYLYDGALINIVAKLKPKTGRLRFKGEYEDTIKVHGIRYNTRYSVYKGEYEQTLKFFELVTHKDGYTPYIHGVFADTIKRRLNVATTSSAYSRVFADSVMLQGRSGCLSIPKADSCFEWKNKMLFRVKTTEFAMIPVTENNILSFLIGETEVTRGLYNALTDTVVVESNYPQSFTNTSILDSLEKVLGIEFKIPTSGQWQWAYKGGDKCQGYTYSGSNTVSDVAWYSGNSDGKVHEVATLVPNELGIYDMAGNLTEITTGGKYGGGYSSAASAVTSNSYSSSSSYGLRLSISF